MKWKTNISSVGLTMCVMLWASTTAVWASGHQQFFSVEVQHTIPDDDGFIRLTWDRPDVPDNDLCFVEVTAPDGSVTTSQLFGVQSSVIFDVRVDHNMDGEYSFFVIYGFIWEPVWNGFQWVGNGLFQGRAWNTNNAVAYIGEPSVAFDDLDGNGNIWFWWDSNGSYVYQRSNSEVSYEGQPFFNKQDRHALRVAYDKKDDPWSFFAAYPSDRTKFAEFDALRMQVRGPVSMIVVFQDASGASWETLVSTAVGDPNDWETLIVDYNGAASQVDLTAIENVLFFVAPGQTWTKGVFYIDNIAFDRLGLPLAQAPTVDPIPLQVDNGDGNISITGHASPGDFVAVWIEKPEYGPSGLHWQQPFSGPMEIIADGAGNFAVQANLADAPTYFNIWATARSIGEGYNSPRSNEQDLLYGITDLFAPKLDGLPETTALNAVIVRGVAEPNAMVVPVVEIPGVGRWDQPPVFADEAGLFEGIAWIFGSDGQPFEIFAYFFDAAWNGSAESERQTVILDY